jgi:hypothetical protein
MEVGADTVAPGVAWQPLPGLPAWAPRDFDTRTRWTNHLGNQSVEPLREYEPRSLRELRGIVATAERAGSTVRAVGSGHSWSDVALTTGFLVRPGGMRSTLDLEDDLLRPRGEAAPPLVRVGAGMRIRELNSHLRARGLSLPNMGGYDGQTIAGATSTSTHGSGATFGPLSDLIESVDIVGAHGIVYRIERPDGPTDPAAYRRAHPDRVLIQDDRWFDAVSVGLGSMGVIHSMMLKVRPAHYLREVRRMSTWDKVREDLVKGDVLKDNLHYEVLFTPYRNDDGQIETLVTTRNEISPEEYREDWHRHRNFLVELAASIPLTSVVIRTVMNLFPKVTPFLLHTSLTSLAKNDYVNISEKVMNIGAANKLPAYSMEIGVPVDSRNLHLQAVDEIIRVAARHRDVGDAYQSSPISLRFVRGTSSYMSMMQGQDTMMIELIMLDGVRGGQDLLADYEDTLYRSVEGRSHWGQINRLTRERIERSYPRFDDWMQVHGMLNGTGVFDSPFTRRTGISG